MIATSLKDVLTPHLQPPPLGDGGAEASETKRVATLMANNSTTLVTHGGGASPLPPVKRLRDKGVTVFAGNDNVRDTLAKSRGYTQVVIAGQVSVATDGKVVGQGDPETQVRQVWRNLEAAVKSAGGSLQHIVKTTPYITHIDHARAVRKVRDELFQVGNPPTSMLLVISTLANPDFMVEIGAIAFLDA